MQGEMLTPYPDGAKALLICSLHDLDPYTGSRGLDRLSVGHTATLWIVAAHPRVFSFCCYRSVADHRRNQFPNVGLERRPTGNNAENC